jgi:hypothetical protein
MSLVVSLAVIFAANYVLRSRSGWMKRQDKTKSVPRDQPFLADKLLPTKTRARLHVMEILSQVRTTETDDQRAELLLEAAQLLKTVDPPEHVALLRRVTTECPKSSRAAKAWAMLIDIKLKAKKKPPPPTNEVQGLIRTIRQFGIGPEKVDPKLAGRVIKVLMNKKCLALAQELQAARDKATPPKKERK